MTSFINTQVDSCDNFETKTIYEFIWTPSFSKLILHELKKTLKDIFNLNILYIQRRSLTPQNAYYRGTHQNIRFHGLSYIVGNCVSQSVILFMPCLLCTPAITYLLPPFLQTCHTMFVTSETENNH